MLITSNEASFDLTLKTAPVLDSLLAQTTLDYSNDNYVVTVLLLKRGYEYLTGANHGHGIIIHQKFGSTIRKEYYQTEPSFHPYGNDFNQSEPRFK